MPFSNGIFQSMIRNVTLNPQRSTISLAAESELRIRIQIQSSSYSESTDAEIKKQVHMHECVIVSGYISGPVGAKEHQ